MSSVVNKSRNKFAPKAKARPRATQSATPAPPEPTHPPPPPAVVIPITAAPAPPPAEPPRARESQPPTLRGSQSNVITAPTSRGVIAAPTSREASRARSESITISTPHARRSPSPPPAPTLPGLVPAPAAQRTSESAEEVGEEMRAPPKRKASAKKAERVKRRKVQDDEVGQDGDGDGDGDDTVEEAVASDNERDDDYQAEEGDAGAMGRGKAKAKGKGKAKEGDGEKKKRAPAAKKTGEKKKAAPRKKKEPKSPRRMWRGVSPEDGEDRKLDESTVKMSDLCRDPMIGKKSKRFVELAEMDWSEVVRKQRATRAEIEARRTAGEEIRVETAQERLGRLEREANAAKPSITIQTRLVNGNMVIDEETLHVDRHQRDALAEEHMEIVEESANTRIINSSSWSRREKAEKWDSDETNRFYEALSMFGTDFEIISRMFPGRSRRQMKNKFNCEERKDPQRISRALRTRVEVDIQDYSQTTGNQFREVQELDAELQKLRDEHDAEVERMAEQNLKSERERQEHANAKMREDHGHAVVDHQPKKKKKGKKDVGGVKETVLPLSIEEYEAQRLRQLEDEW